MPTLKFKIGDGFPAKDPVARFISVLAMISNEWLRSIEELVSIEGGGAEEEGLRIAKFRYQASLHYEAAGFIADAKRRFSEIASFVDALDEHARRECEAVLAGADSKSPEYLGKWVERNRGVTFHFPEMHPQKAEHDKEEITQALQDAADIESTIEFGETFASVRFRFADQLAVQWLPDAEADRAEAEAALTNLREAALALARFAQRAARSYLESRPEGTFEEE
jgi:hypothetical protein